MKIYIMTDFEGISGVCSGNYLDEGGPFFQEARRYLMGDVNAAIAGCFDGGATEVVVRDGHFKGLNFILGDLDERAVHDYGSKPWTGQLDASFDATMIIGQHAMAGTLNGFLTHTMSSHEWWSYSINGHRHGELGMWAAIAGHFNVPLVFVCGDKAACAEGEALIPGMTTVAVKEGRGRQKAACKPVRQAQAEIRSGVAAAVAGIANVKPYKIDLPATCELICCRADMADGYDGRPDVERVDARTVRKVIESPLDMLI